MIELQISRLEAEIQYAEEHLSALKRTHKTWVGTRLALIFSDEPANTVIHITLPSGWFQPKLGDEFPHKGFLYRIGGMSRRDPQFTSYVAEQIGKLP